MLMANTVNDVMNVIASPDYGIKNIAGTTQEILAILGGVHNSKNNIHAIVDDVRSLLQKLVDTAASKKNPIEIGDKSSKINHKNIQDILDETKGIRKAIDNLAKILETQGGGNMPAVAKLGDKASEKVAEAMIKDIEKQKGGGGMSALVDAFTKLRDISLKDLILGNAKIKLISNIFKNAKEDLKIDAKDLNNIIKLINVAPEIMKALNKVGRRIDKIIKNKVIEKLNEMLLGKKNSLIALAKDLQKNEKTFNSGSKAAKSIEELSMSLHKAMREIVFAALWSNLANIGIACIDFMIDNILTLSKKLTKNKKDIDNGAKAAKNITIFTGNLLIASIFLTISLITVIPAILGALCMQLLVDILIQTGKKLSRSQKQISQATGAALIFTAFTGLMLISSFFLTKIAENGLMSLLGSVIVLGVVAISVITFTILNKAKKNIIMGAVMMAIMSVSLILFGIALGKITKATEKVTWKQVAIIATMLIMLALATAVMGEPTTASFIALGSLTMSLMSVGLIVFGVALGKISNATKKLKFKQVLLVAGSILALGIPVAGAGFLAGPVTLGSIALTSLSLALRPFLKTLSKISKATENLKIEQIETVASSMMILGLAVVGMGVPPISLLIGMGAVALGTMGSALYIFVKSLKMISDMGSVPKKDVNEVIEVMRTVKDFFKENALSFKAIRSAMRYQTIMIPLGIAIKHLSKINEMGGKIPTDLITQTLTAMDAIGKFYIENPIENKTIKAARKYKRMMKPFGKTVSLLNTLKKMGGVPMKLVYQTLNAMSTIANYYINNPIERTAIKNARKYKRMMKPFGKTIEYLSKLKAMGSIPIKLVYQTLNTMSTIANYYINNPIERKAIKNARKYKRMMKPFGTTIEYLSKLKAMGSLPIKLIHQTLNAISTIVGFYRNQDMGSRKARKKMKRSAEMITTIVASFGIAVNAMKTLSDLKRLPSQSIQSAISAIRDITWFYTHTHVGDDDIEEKCVYFEFAVDKFTNMAKNIQDKFKGLKNVDHKSVRTIVRACESILNFYTFTLFFAPTKKIIKMNNAVRIFAENIKYLKQGVKDGFSLKDYISIRFTIKSMRRILKFLKRNSLNILQARKAQRSISLITGLASAMLNISKINPLELTSVGNSLTNALSGVQSIDIGQIQAVTDMFNAFQGINKSENIINKFAESVKEFTSSCKELTEAMNNNVGAINNMNTSNDTEGSIFDRIKNKVSDFIGFGSSGNDISSNTQSDGGGIRIINVDEIANTIAAKINGAISVDIPDTQVQLTINGTGGNEWIISKY